MTRDLDIVQSAKLLGLSYVRVHQFCKSGRLGEKVNARWRITREELEIFKASRNIPDKTNKVKIKMWLDIQKSGHNFGTLALSKILSIPRSSTFAALNQLASDGVVIKAPSRTKDIAIWTCK